MSEDDKTVVALNDTLTRKHPQGIVELSGYQMATYTKTVCDDMKINKSSSSVKERVYKQILTISQKESLYCPVAKVSSTFWRRVVYLLEMPSKRYKHPFDVPISAALSLKRRAGNLNTKHNGWFNFIIVRNPYMRLLSAYIDKVFVPNPTFWDKFGKPSIKMFRENATKTSIKCGHDPTFSEFVQFVIWSLSNKQLMDNHFIPVSEQCLPCDMNFTFVGRMESATSDFHALLDHFGLGITTTAMGSRFEDITAEDAIADSINSPFGWKRSIVKCMNWNEALMRVWRKLQIRGLIGMSQIYSLTKTEASKIKSSEFIKLAKAARQKSNSSELKDQKKMYMQTIYKTVPLEILKKLPNVYGLDIKLFRYDDSLDFILSNSTPKWPSYNYLDFKI